MPRRRIAASLALAFALAASAAAAAPPDSSAQAPPPALTADTRLAAADLRADAVVLRRVYEALHPGLLRYNTPAQIDAAFGALDREFQRDRTLADAYLAFATLAAKVRCGHTYANFFNQRRAVQAALFQQPRVPFDFRWLGQRMVVTRSFASDPRIRPGTEVLALNGVPVARILARLMTVGRADGHNDAKRRADLQVEGTSRYEAFDVYWPLFFPSDTASVTLRVREPGSARVHTVQAPRVPYAERLALIEAAEGPGAAKDAPLWQLDWLDDRTGLLRMPSWVLYNSGWNWQASLDTIFATLVQRGASDLVIDLRLNEGGSDVGDVIVGHLVTAPVPRQVATRLVRYRKVPDDLAPYLDTWDPSFKDWGAAAIDSTDRFYRLRRDADDDPGGVIAPLAPRFAGRVWVLVGATNSSATFEFALTVRQNHLATLVGQPTGGNQRGINGGAFFFVRLPRTKLELDLPLIGQFMAGDRPDAGLEPDVSVVTTVNDIAAGRDAELEAVRARIRQSRRP